MRRDDAGAFEYVAQPFTSRLEMRAMLNGLTESRQLEAATKVLSAFLTISQQRSSSSSSSRARDENRELGVTQTDDERLVAIVLNGCADLGQMDRATPLLRLMRERGVPLTALTFCILFKGHGRAGDWARVRKLHKALRDSRGVAAFDLPTFNALLDAYARQGDVQAAEAVLSEMSAHGVTPSSRTYNTLLKCHAQHGQLADAFSVAVRMRKALGAGGGPDAVTYATLMHGCVQRGELRMARILMERLASGEAEGVRYIARLALTCLDLPRLTDAARSDGRRVSTACCRLSQP